MSGDAYHVFLSHNEADKPVVERLARKLEKEGLHPWLDTWNLVPGAPWQEPIETALQSCQSCAILCGASGIGPWQHEEMRTAIERRVGGRNSLRVIPVLLPGATRELRSLLPPFLKRTAWVEFRRNIDDPAAFHLLKCGILGISPGPPTLRGVDGQYLCPYRGLDAFSIDDADVFFGREVSIDWLLNDIRNLTERRSSRLFSISGSVWCRKIFISASGFAGIVKTERD